MCVITYIGYFIVAIIALILGIGAIITLAELIIASIKHDDEMLRKVLPSYWFDDGDK